MCEFVIIRLPKELLHALLIAVIFEEYLFSAGATVRKVFVEYAIRPNLISEIIYYVFLYYRFSSMNNSFVVGRMKSIFTYLHRIVIHDFVPEVTFIS